MSITILIAEDDALLRGLLAAVLSRNEELQELDSADAGSPS